MRLGMKAQSVAAPDMPIAHPPPQVATEPCEPRPAAADPAAADPDTEANTADDEDALVRLMLDGGANLGIANDPSIIADGVDPFRFLVRDETHATGRISVPP